MITEEQVRKTFNDVIVPGVMRSVAGLNLVRGVDITDSQVKIILADAAFNDLSRTFVEAAIKANIKKQAGHDRVIFEYAEAKPKEINQIKKVVAVMSGKGGVGKSLVTALLGVALSRQGKEVGILDADITGPSIPRMFGTGPERPNIGNNCMLPVTSKMGIEIMSVNLLLPNEDDAVIWRGPIIAKVIQQFWEDVVWGNLDYMIVDLPPGTADAPLTVLQSLPVAGIVIVFSPQELAAMVVRKAVKMANTMNIPILGLVENMSYFEIPDTGKRIELFGKSKVDAMVKTTGTSLMVQIPVEPKLAQLSDEGKIENYKSKDFDTFAKQLDKHISEMPQKK